jgi:hypothetical protein
MERYIPTTTRASRASATVASPAQLAFAAIVTEASDAEIYGTMVRVGRPLAQQMVDALLFT